MPILLPIKKKLQANMAIEANHPQIIIFDYCIIIDNCVQYFRNRLAIGNIIYIYIYRYWIAHTEVLSLVCVLLFLKYLLILRVICEEYYKYIYS